MSRYFLIEEDDPAFSLEGGQAIALSPWAAQSLKARGQSYKILEDFYSEKDLRAEEDDFFKNQLEWLHEFDALLHEHLPVVRKNHWKLAGIHLNRLKYLVDSFLIRSFIARKFFDQAKPSSLVYAGVEYLTEPEAALYQFRRHDRWSYGPLLKLWAGRGGIPWETHFVRSERHSAKKKSPPSLRVRGRALGKKIRNFFHFQKYRPASALEKGRSKKFLFLDAGISSMDQLIRDCLHAGHEVYLKQDKTIMALHEWKEGAYSLAASEEVISEHVLAALENSFFESKLFQGFSFAAFVNVDSLLKPYFLHFFRTVLPDVIREALAMKRFFESQSIDAVIARSSAGANYPAALLAASSCKIPRICFQHSAGPGDMKDWAFDELAFFDYSFAISTPLAGYFQAQTALEKLYQHCTVLESSGHLENISSKRKSKNVSSKPVLLYVPAKLAGGMMHFNTQFYPMSWYYEHQIKILSFLAARQDYTVIYKHLDQQTWANRSIILWLKKSHFPNIRIEEGAFSEFLPLADRVLFDYPSTGFFESAAAGAPVLALYHEAMKIWPPMKDVFGDSLQAFASTEEAIQRIKNYLDRPAEEFQPELPFIKGSSYAHLSKILQQLTPAREKSHVPA